MPHPSLSTLNQVTIMSDWYCDLDWQYLDVPTFSEQQEMASLGSKNCSYNGSLHGAHGIARDLIFSFPHTNIFCGKAHDAAPLFTRHDN